MPLACAMIAEVAASRGIPPAEILGRSKEHRIYEARAEIIRRLRQHPSEFSMKTIGRWMNRHHTSVLNCLRTAPKIPTPVYDSSQPDESGVWAI